MNSKEIEIERRRDNANNFMIKSVLTENWEMCESQEKFKNFVCRKDKSGFQKYCLLWDSRVLVRLKLRERVLCQLHSCSPRVSRMEA